MSNNDLKKSAILGESMKLASEYYLNIPDDLIIKQEESTFKKDILIATANGAVREFISLSKDSSSGDFNSYHVGAIIREIQEDASLNKTYDVVIMLPYDGESDCRVFGPYTTLDEATEVLWSNRTYYHEQWTVDAESRIAFFLKVLINSQTGTYLFITTFCLICGAVGEMYYPSGVFLHFDAPISWVLFTIMSFFYGLVVMVISFIIGYLIISAYDDLKKTAEEIRNKSQ